MTTSRAPRTETAWRPTAGRDALAARAEMLASIRAFFAERAVLEVETPLLGRAGVTDPHLQNLESTFTGPGFAQGLRLYLQTSPEYHMKRLLAAGGGPIYQICKAFRDGESGRSHNPEFTILEWYRPEWDHQRLMDEVSDLLIRALDCRAAVRRTYASLFEQALGVDPHGAGIDELEAVYRGRCSTEPPPLDAPDDWLALLMSQFIEPSLGADAPTLVYDYPASQASLSRVREGSPPVAERFEVYFRGVELANGFHELSDVDEQRRRFEADRRQRRCCGLDDAALDTRLLDALESGLPDCAGVALGVDRLLMLALGAESIDQVLAFPVDRA